MTLPVVTGRGWRGGAFAAGPAAPSGVTYDEDAQTYFDTLEAASGWSEPADYADKKSAISDYFTNLKEDSNFTEIKAMYLPIWRVAAPNAINAVNPGTYDLTFVNTVTHNGGDYIYGDGAATNGGYAHGGFHGVASSNAKFFEVGSASMGCNALNDTGSQSAAFGWYNFCALFPYWSGTTAGLYWMTTTHNNISTGMSAPTLTSGFWSLNSIAPGAGKTNRAQLWRNGSSMHTTTAATGSGLGGGLYDSTPMSLMARMHSNGAAYSESAIQFNFWFFGTEITDMAAFNTDTATMLAAI